VAPDYIKKLFYDNLVARKPPADVACEQRVVGAMFGNADATGGASGYLVPEDFTDPTAQTTFRQTVAGYKAAGGRPKPLPLNTPFAVDCLRLRRIHARRRVEQLGWRLAHAACTADDPGTWCREALREIQVLAERIHQTAEKPCEAGTTEPAS